MRAPPTADAARHRSCVVVSRCKSRLDGRRERTPNDSRVIDTHAHVHDPAFDPDRDEMLVRARSAGIDRIITIGCDLADSRRALTTAAQYGLDATIGIHPHEAKGAPGDIAAAFDVLVAQAVRRPVAIGETGLDFYYDHSPRERQRDVLVAQIRYARDHDYPLVFHVRDAFESFVEVLQAELPHGYPGVVHCFTGSVNEARTYTDEFGLLLGIGGVVTFKAADALREAVRAVDARFLILETDCPYLAPVPHRGRRNEPAFVAATAAALSGVLGVALETLTQTTTANTTRLFGPPSA